MQELSLVHSTNTDGVPKLGWLLYPFFSFVPCYLDYTCIPVDCFLGGQTGFKALCWTGNAYLSKTTFKPVSLVILYFSWSGSGTHSTGPQCHKSHPLPIQRTVSWPKLWSGFNPSFTATGDRWCDLGLPFGLIFSFDSFLSLNNKFDFVLNYLTVSCNW